MNFNTLAIAFFTVSILGAACPAKAEEFRPQLHGLVTFELEDDWAVDSDNSDSEVNSLYTTISPYLIFSLTEHLALETALVFETVRDPDAGEDNYFENEGLYTEEIKLSYEGDNYSVFAGKFDPSFGSAWDLTPGVYGTEFAEDYQLLERIGAGGSYTLGEDETGEYTVTANAFFADTTLFSDSLFESRGDVDKDDGGLSNTEGFSSYSVTLDGENAAGIEGFNANLGYRSQAEGDADTGLDTEHGYVAGANYTFALSEAVEANVIGEWAGLRNLDGTDDEADYYTAGIGIAVGNWNAATSWTGRNIDSTADDTNDDLYQASVGYTFSNGMTFDVGYKHTDVSDIDTDTLGGLLTYTYEF